MVPTFRSADPIGCRVLLTEFGHLDEARNLYSGSLRPDHLDFRIAEDGRTGRALGVAATYYNPHPPGVYSIGLIGVIRELWGVRLAGGSKLSELIAEDLEARLRARLGYVPNLWAFIASDNAPSLALAAQFGFEPAFARPEGSALMRPGQGPIYGPADAWKVIR